MPIILMFSFSVIEDGALLRSGTSLKSERSVLERLKTQKRKSLPAKSSASHRKEKSVVKQGTYVGRRSLGADVTNSNLHTDVRSRSHGSSRSSSSVSVRKVLVEEFEEAGMEKGMKEIQNTKTRERNGRSIKYGYGMYM